MLILDNSVLSALTNIGILDLLKKLNQEVFISPDVAQEYSKKWVTTNLPNWIKMVNPKISLNIDSLSLSNTDVTVIALATEKVATLASDDKVIRKMAKELKVNVIGTLGLLKLLYQQRIINTKEEYIKYLRVLQDDIFLSDELIEWAREIND